MLAPYHIRSRTIRLHLSQKEIQKGKKPTFKGYVRTDFVDSWRSFLEPDKVQRIDEEEEKAAKKAAKEAAAKASAEPSDEPADEASTAGEAWARPDGGLTGTSSQPLRHKDLVHEGIVTPGQNTARRNGPSPADVTTPKSRKSLGGEGL
jgi:hypothetical protein